MINKNILKLSVVGLVVIVAALFTQNVLSKESGNPDVVILTSNNAVALNDVVDGESVSSVLSSIKKLHPKKEADGRCHIKLFLNTPGGIIQSGLELNEALNGNDCVVDTITLFAASMGFQIAQNLGERLILKNGTLMSHRAKGGFSGEFGGQRPSQVESRYQFWLDRIEEMDKTTVSRTKNKQTLESYQKQYASEMWLTGAKAVERGYADRVVSIKCDASLNGVTTHTTEYMGMPVQYDLDNCPINTSPTNIRMNIETTRGFMDTDTFLKQGGSFAPSCLASSSEGKLCSMDTSLSISKISEIKNNFINKYNARLRAVVYDYGVF